ncbi:MAG: DegT/DnrJ/EryC1/StrS family aminotransferase [Acidobacteria bacterium]|nr:DegT/DnrJ/EryC1/StrS family aminotransferase [Acidobacteriota bacterium]
MFGELEEKAVLDVLRSGKWSRSSGGKRAIEFEARYAELTGAKYCLATANGTSALIAALNACDVGPGDAVLLPPYTFVATLNVVLLQHALPIFVDSDLETFQIDAGKLDAAVTPECRVVLPVHLGGAAADLDTILAFAKRRGLKVIEDACQSHLGEWRGKKVGTLGDCGCFSFQASKNLNSGEGGALVTNDEALMDRAYAFHGNGRGRKAEVAGFTYASNGANLRLTDFQGALLLAQMTRLEEQSRRREQNAKYLAAMLAKIPGIKPARLYDGCTRNAWHLFMFRLESGAGVSRARFLKNLSAKGVSGSSGYSPLNKEPFLKRIIEGRHYKRVYGERRIREWVERNNCPVNDRLCQEAVWFSQTTLLGSRSEMEQIAEAVSKARTA